ncbi:MAG TPA: DUF362 domain-containing protein [Fimbriiglobus sp.]
MDKSLVDWLAEADPARLIVVKPNWVDENHGTRPDDWEPVITHPAVVATVVEGLAELMGGRGTIVLCDAPITYARFAAIAARGDLPGRLARIKFRFPALAVELLDLRREIWIQKEDVVTERLPNPPDPRGYAQLDLGPGSLFYRYKGEGRYYGADYDTSVVNAHHWGEVQEYLLAGTPMTCDLFVNLPKLKTHKKTGITCSLKNLVGVNGDKNWLPHFIQGEPRLGGDEFPAGGLRTAFERRLRRFGQQAALAVPGLGSWAFRKMRNVGLRVMGDSEAVARGGNWQGNDTCWRMALDLNRALLFGNLDGTWREAERPHRYMTIVDGIVGGQGNGPLSPDPAPSGVLLGGTNPAAVDAVACRLMGFDPATLPIVSRAFDPHRWPISACQLDEVMVTDGGGPAFSQSKVRPAIPGGFRPHFGWPMLDAARSA